MVTRDVMGCITQEKYILGKTPKEMESLLGFEEGFLRNGAIVLALSKLPENSEFELATSYTNVPQKPKENVVDTAESLKLKEKERIELETDKRILKRDLQDYRKTMARNSWSESGVNRLVKVIPKIYSVKSYPPGLGVPQWKLIKPVKAEIVGEFSYNQQYH
jgi:hypothetical protein